MSSSNHLSMARALFRNYGAMKNFERCANKCRVVYADEGRLKVELHLEHEHTNLHGTLHGGLTATLVDIVTSTAICLTKRQTDGISVDLSVSFLAPAKVVTQFWWMASSIALAPHFASPVPTFIGKVTAQKLRQRCTRAHTCEKQKMPLIK